MRVLFVIHSGVFGGPHNQALRLAAPLRHEGFETTVLLPDEPGDAQERLRAGGVDVIVEQLHRVRASPDPRAHIGLVTGFGREVRALRRIMREGFDIVQIGGLVNPHAGIAARMERRPVVWQLLDTRAPAPIARAAMFFVRNLATVAMPTGRHVIPAFPGADRLGARLIPFIPPVDTELFRPRPWLRSEARAELGLGPSDPIVGSIANINPQKGILTLIEAFSRIRQSVRGARLVMVGAESDVHARYAASVRSALADAGLVEGVDVLLTGSRRDVDRLLSAFDVLLLTSVPRSEGIPTVVLEAMASGLPVVVTNVGGVSEVVESGISGIVVPPLDAGAVADAAIRLLEDHALAERLGIEARLRAAASFSIEQCVAVHVQAYRMALRLMPMRPDPQD